jgi:hypothetical protein
MRRYWPHFLEQPNRSGIRANVQLTTKLLLPVHWNLLQTANCGDKVVASAYGKHPFFSFAYPSDFYWSNSDELRLLVKEIESRGDMLSLLRSRLGNIEGLFVNIKSEFFSSKVEPLGEDKAP